MLLLLLLPLPLLPLLPLLLLPLRPLLLLPLRPRRLSLALSADHRARGPLALPWRTGRGRGRRRRPRGVGRGRRKGGGFALFRCRRGSTWHRWCHLSRRLHPPPRPLSASIHLGAERAQFSSLPLQAGPPRRQGRRPLQQAPPFRSDRLGEQTRKKLKKTKNLRFSPFKT